MPMPSMNVAEFCAFGPRGTGANPTVSTTFDFVLSTSGAEKPTPSIHIAARAWLNVVWLSFQLNPTTPGGAQSRISF